MQISSINRKIGVNLSNRIENVSVNETSVCFTFAPVSNAVNFTLLSFKYFEQ